MTGTHPHPFEGPPPDLGRRSLPIRSFANTLYRVHLTARAPIYASKHHSRFSAPSLPFGVCYAATTLLGAFAETCLSYHPAKKLFFARNDDVQTRSYAAITPNRALRLVDLTGPSITTLGTTEAINTTDRYDLTQLWSAALHDHPAAPDGILYLCNHAGEQGSVAIFERALPALLSTPPIPFVADLSTLNGLLETLGAPLLP